MDKEIIVTIRGDEGKIAEVTRSIVEQARPGTTVEVRAGEDVIIVTCPESEREWLEEYLRLEFA
ncbi:MAG TPA: hypothetical protein PKE45_23730 [Caldilineaceae bacterium]|nr:hypothetical protein [Caldilineaceae bacterium]